MSTLTLKSLKVRAEKSILKISNSAITSIASIILSALLCFLTVFSMANKLTVQEHPSHLINIASLASEL